MSEASPPRLPCFFCERAVSVRDLWQCECGRVDCCQTCVDRLPEYHRSGECGLDAALDRALARDDYAKH
jgi:hypothetical protein